jgi:hypothetical protein
MASADTLVRAAKQALLFLTSRTETLDASAGSACSDPLVGYWKFDEGQGTTLLDSSGIGNNGTISSAVGWGTTTLAAMAPPALNAWHHVAYTFDGTTHRLYLDEGTPVSGTSAPNASGVTRADLGSWNGVGFLNGGLDELRIYNVALTAAQIAKLAAGAPSAQ